MKAIAIDKLRVTSYTSRAITAHLCLHCNKSFTENPAHRPGTTQESWYLHQYKEIAALKRETINFFCTHIWNFPPAHQQAVSQVNYMLIAEIIVRLKNLAER